MALSGTLKDFGIADILQLIGHQQKTGSLLLKNGREEVEVSFADGNVVFAAEKHRSSKNFLGSMLVRAEVISEPQLEEALIQQQRSLKRLGDILVEIGALSQPQLAQIARLQTTETLYKLFRWKSGTYEFTQREIDAGKSSFEPIRAESILLEGFRRMDEWPAVRKKIPWDEASCIRSQELDVRDLPQMDDGGFGFDGGGGGEGDGKPGERHKLVYRLAEPGRTVSKIVDLTRLGEFETLKAMQELVDWNYLRIVPPARGAGAAMKELAAGGRAFASRGGIVRVAITVTFFLGTLFLLRQLLPSLGASRAEHHARRGASARLIARTQQIRLEGALELYRLEHAEYPKELNDLVQGKLVSENDLKYPFSDTWYYRKAATGFVLLPPLD
ncbi:MAG: DUF4388 domain-containing protein [Deltaproteobacteria bacterium]|nr:DUF4388 domain-containing protein [Deltaproteobacteria bacterium]